MNIGQVADATGLTAKMIRYYEEAGLVRKVQRSAAGYRNYDAHDHVFRFINRARGLGFSVGQISRLLALWRDTSRSSAQVKALSLNHVAELKRRIEELNSIVDVVTDLAERCDGDERPDCPIIDDLASGTNGSDAPVRSEARPPTGHPQLSRRRKPSRPTPAT